MEYPDRRIKAIVLTMASGGLRLGVWDYLKWGNVIPIVNDGELVAAKIIVYDGEEDEYFSFITPGCATLRRDRLKKIKRIDYALKCDIYI
jgi:hypothetical protein